MPFINLITEMEAISHWKAAVQLLCALLGLATEVVVIRS